MSDKTTPTPGTPDTIAAVDLGSNSFHMIVARVMDGHIQVIDRLREMVRLGAGLNEKKQLTPDARARALACLARFGQRLRALPPGSVRAVGTNALRQARKADLFLDEAQAALGHPIEVIAGHEEARLIYLGVAHGLAADSEQRLVVDIGGGSTEIIIGRGFNISRRESLYMGCVSISQAHFPDGRIKATAMKAAEVAAAMELHPVRRAFRRTGWQRAIGSSGTIRTIEEVVRNAGWSSGGITLSSLKKLRKALIAAGHADRVDLEGLSLERQPVFPGGVAVLLALFKTLHIRQMQVSDQALREGLLYDMLGRIRHEDVRERTVLALCRRYDLDIAHAVQVDSLAQAFSRQADWGLAGKDHRNLLGWAARLHEIGLAVSHSQFHKHGAYLIEHSDLPGFSRREQLLLATLVRGHRRKFPLEIFETLPEVARKNSRRLCVLLRLAVLLHRGRSTMAMPTVTLTTDKNDLNLRFPNGWLKGHPLTRMELEQERKQLENAGFNLSFG